MSAKRLHERSAMILAAGLGTRMRPITETMPKPLVPVGGRALIDYAFDALRSAGIAHAVVNLHYLPDAMRSHLASVEGLSLEVSDETDQLLDSGGGVARALPMLGHDPFVLLNADTFWIDDADCPQGAISQMLEAFDEASMDILMLLADPDRATGHGGGADFSMDEAGRLTRFDRSTHECGLIYAGALVLHPRIVAAAPKGPFSLNRLFDQAIAADRMRGLLLKGHWITVGTPDAIAPAEAAIANAVRPRSGEAV